MSMVYKLLDISAVTLRAALSVQSSDVKSGTSGMKTCRLSHGFN